MSHFRCISYSPKRQRLCWENISVLRTNFADQADTHGDEGSHLDMNHLGSFGSLVGISWPVPRSGSILRSLPGCSVSKGPRDPKGTAACCIFGHDQLLISCYLHLICQAATECEGEGEACHGRMAAAKRLFVAGAPGKKDDAPGQHGDGLHH